MVRIPFSDGTLEGALELPAGGVVEGNDAVVVCHPHPAFGGRMHNPLIVAIASGFVAAGLPALRFHYRGIGASDGRATGGIVEEADVLAADAYLRAEGARRVALVGYSFGALMAMKALAAGARPPAYVGVAMPTSLIDGNPERIADLDKAMSAGVPIAFISGDADPLCDVARMRAFSRGRATIEVLPGEPHAFSIVGTTTVVRAVVDFVRGALR